MSYPSVDSQIRSKRQQFHKEIRSKTKNQYFAAQRKLLFEAQLNQSASINNQQKQTIINQPSQLQQHLHHSFTHDYQAINNFIKNYHDALPSSIQEKLVEISVKPEFLKNEHALVMLVSLWNVKNFNSQLLTEEKIISWIRGVVEYNLVLEDAPHRIFRIDFFSTVCWFLFALSAIVNDKSLFLPLVHHYPTMQSQADDLTFEFVCLLSQLSTNPQLLPSQVYIQQLLKKSPESSRNKNFMIFVVKLLDNYLRYNCQKLHRFQKEENGDLVIQYLKFISDRLKDMKFDNHLKTELIQLMTCLVKSSSFQVVDRLFDTRESSQFCIQIFYRAEFDQWERKLASLHCLFEILCQQRILPKVTQLLGAEAIAHLCISTLSLPDRQIQLYILACMNVLMNAKPKVYKKQFKKYDFGKSIRQLQHSDRLNLESDVKSYNLSELAQSIYETHFIIDEQ